MSPYKNDVWGLIHEFYVCCEHLLMLQSQKTSEITELKKKTTLFRFSRAPTLDPQIWVLQKKKITRQVEATALGFFIIDCHWAWRRNVPPTNHMFSNQPAQPQPASNCLLHKLCNTSLVLPHIYFHWRCLSKTKRRRATLQIPSIFSAT